VPRTRERSNFLPNREIGGIALLCLCVRSCSFNYKMSHILTDLQCRSVHYSMRSTTIGSTLVAAPGCSRRALHSLLRVSCRPAMTIRRAADGRAASVMRMTISRAATITHRDRREQHEPQHRRARRRDRRAHDVAHRLQSCNRERRFCFLTICRTDGASDAGARLRGCADREREGLRRDAGSEDPAWVDHAFVGAQTRSKAVVSSDAIISAERVSISRRSSMYTSLPSRRIPIDGDEGA